MSKYKWVVNDELVSRGLDDDHTLEVTMTKTGLKIRVWKEPGDIGKRLLLYHKMISIGELGHIIPEEKW